MTTGLHHVTLITRKVQANVDFYTGFLGLRLIKRTGGFEDALQLHLIYGDRLGAPGSLVTFLVWEDGAPGRVGAGQVGEIAFAIDPASMGFWIERALRMHVAHEGPVQELGEPVLRLRDPDGVTVKLVGVAGRHVSDWAPGTIPAEHALRRMRAVTLFTEKAETTADFVRRHFGFADGAVEGNVRRLVSEAGDAVDVRDAKGFWPGGPGPGTADHIAFRASDVQAVTQLEATLGASDNGPLNLHDRKYFTSLYVREPAGILFEYASDGPGFVIDETEETLGTTLFVPENNASHGEDIKIALPQFGLPGEPRVIYRDLPFIHRFFTPDDADGSVLVLLHGSGGNEIDLMPLGHHVAPRATLLALRGRSYETGAPRWFKRTDDGFDQDDIAFEAEAFAAFLDEARAAYGLAPEQMTFLGYSNGANFLAALMQLRPGLVQRAALLRPVSVLTEPKAADLDGTRLLVVAGKDDVSRQATGNLATALRSQGADVTLTELDAGHGLHSQDEDVVRTWLARRPD